MQDAQTAGNEAPRFYALRHDTLLGPCQALGDEIGFDPTLLRVVLCALLFWSPAIVIGGYLGAAAFVALTDWLFPKATARAAAAQAQAEPAVARSVAAERQRDDRREPELIAA